MAAVQITRTEVIVPPDSIAQLRREFHESGIARLPGFLSAPLCGIFSKRMPAGAFDLKQEVGHRTGAVFGTTFFMSTENPVVQALHLTLNRPELFDLASAVSGIPRPGNFACRLHRTVPASKQHIDWHDDQTDGRVLGLNINLSEAPFSGGLFELRNPGGQTTASIQHTNPGDAFIFRIGSGWQHRLTQVDAGVRTVAVGWFRSGPDWQALAAAAFSTGRVLCL